MANGQGLIGMGTELYAAWKGESGDDRLFLGTFVSGVWKDLGTVPGNSSHGPSLTTSAGEMLAAWKGEHDDQRLFYSTFDGNEWAGVNTIPGNSDYGPALGEFNGTPFAAWKGEWADLRLFWSSFVGGSWKPQQQIPGVLSVATPSLAEFGDKLYAAWRGALQDEAIYFAAFDGQKWAGPNAGSSYGVIPGVQSSTGPSIASLGGRLVAVWKGMADDQAMYYASYDGTTWVGDAPGTSQGVVPDALTSAGPTVAVLGGLLYAIWKDSTSQSIRCASFDGTTWTTQPVVPGNTGPDAAIEPPAGLGSNSNYLLSSSCNPILGLEVAIKVTEDVVSENGFGFQLNAYPPKNETDVWQQYFFSLQTQSDGSAILYGYVDNWSSSTVIIGDAPELISLPSPRIPAGYTLTITLGYDAKSNVNKVTYGVVDNHGTTLASTPIELQTGSIPSTDLSPILSFELNLVGPINGQSSILSGGAGSITYKATTPLTACSVAPSCVDVTEITAERANSAYGLLPATAATTLVQRFKFNATSDTPWMQ